MFALEVRRVWGSTTPCFDKAGALVCCWRLAQRCSASAHLIPNLVRDKYVNHSKNDRVCSIRARRELLSFGFNRYCSGN